MGSSKKQTVGYKYFLGVQMALAHGPLDSISKIEVDRRVAWEGLVTGGTISVNATELFGGDKREGGVSGAVDIEMGLPTQSRNSYLQSVLGTDIPAFRGVACAVLNQCYMGNNPYLKPWAFEVTRIQKTTGGASQWYSGKAVISRDGSSLPSNCSYSCDSIANSFLAAAEHFWPMDDPQHGSTVPSEWRRTKGTEYTLTNNRNVGVAWDGGAIDTWTVNTESLGTLSLCDNDAQYVQHVYDTVPHHTTMGGYTTTAQFLDSGFWTTYLVTETEALGFVHDHNINFLRSGSQTITMNPRITVTRDAVNKEMVFTSSLNGGQEVLRIGYNTNFKLHAITIKSPVYEWQDLNNGTFDFAPVYEIQVDDSEPQQFTFSVVTPFSASSFAFQSWSWIRPFRGGTASHLGHSFNLLNSPHSALWEAVQANHTDFDPVAAGIQGCFTCSDMNPAHIIRECLTDTAWGMGYATSDIDSTSFEAAADTLHTEGMGISILWDREQPIDDFIGLILQHIDAVLYVSRSTGKFVLNLIREQVPTVTLDETNVSDVNNAKRPTVSELTNLVNVVYWNCDTDEQASLSLHNEALRQVQGVEISTTQQYPGFTQLDIAQRVAERDLRALSTPLLSCEVIASREAAVLNIGDTFTLSWPDLNISSVTMRANEIDYGDGIDNSVKILAVEDVFATPSETVRGTPSEVWTDPDTGTPVAAVARVLTETPYYVLVQEIGEIDADAILANDSDAGFLLAAGGRAGAELNANVLVDAGSGYVDSEVVDFHPYAELSADITETSTVLTIQNDKDMDLLETGTIAQIGDELVRVDAVTESSPTGSYVSVTVGRGILDTTPRRHLTGAVISFWDESAVSDDEQYAAGETVDVKLVTALAGNFLDQSSAPVDSVTFASRAWRPYPPGDLKVDGLSYPQNYMWRDDHTFTWVNRDRLQQTDGNLYDHFDSGIGPEAGTTYRVEGYAYTSGSPEVETKFIDIDVGSALTWTFDAAEVAAEAGVSYPPSDAARLVIKVFAVRGSPAYDSYQAAELQMDPAALADAALSMAVTFTAEVA